LRRIGDAEAGRGRPRLTLFSRLKKDAAPEWRAYVGHAFVRQIGEGTLPEASFRHYLVQDYLFLIQFARAYALAVYKSRTLDEMRHSGTAMSAILDEMRLHVRFSARWGLTPADLEAAREARATVAYTRFVLDEGQRGDLLDLMTALAPCVIGYAEIGLALAAEPIGRSKKNPYREWIAEYAGAAYQAIGAEAVAELDRLGAELLTRARYPRLFALFRQATRLEADFWDMGLTLAD
jgi:thiaminase/transcriptional activator TenA